MTTHRMVRRGAAVWLLLLAAVLLSCAAEQTLSRRVTTVAVWDLDDLSPTVTGMPHLGELLASQVTETLKTGDRYEVIERQRFALALEELRLGTSALADEGTRLRLGRVAGARFMVFGGYVVLGGQMRIDLRLVEVESGKVVKAVHKTAQSESLEECLAAARSLAEML